jgi:Family of unknown function (DUF6011)
MDDVQVTEERESVPDWAKQPGSSGQSMAPPGTPGGMSGPKITPPQRKYLLDLIQKKQVKPDQEGKLDLIMKCLRISEDSEEYGMSKAKASELIDWFVKQPDKPRHLQPMAATEANKQQWPKVPAGRYAVPNQVDVLQFYTVDCPTEGRWAGYTFLSVWASDEKHPIRNTETKLAILNKIAADPKAAAERFGQEIGRCGICGRTLTDATSRSIGIGPVCRENSEWY